MWQMTTPLFRCIGYRGNDQIRANTELPSVVALPVLLQESFTWAAESISSKTFLDAWANDADFGISFETNARCH